MAVVVSYRPLCDTVPQPLTGKDVEDSCRLLFRRVRKIAKSDYQLYVRPSVRMEQLGSQWTDFDET